MAVRHDLSKRREGYCSLAAAYNTQWEQQTSSDISDEEHGEFMPNQYHHFY